MTRRRAEQLAAQENEADNERCRQAKARRMAFIATRVKETHGWEKEGLLKDESNLQRYMARLLYLIVEAGEYDDNENLLYYYDGVAEALEGAREVHQEERDAAQAAEAGAVADGKLAARNARMAGQKAKKVLDEV